MGARRRVCELHQDGTAGGQCKVCVLICLQSHITFHVCLPPYVCTNVYACLARCLHYLLPPSNFVRHKKSFLEEYIRFGKHCPAFAAYWVRKHLLLHVCDFEWACISITCSVPIQPIHIGRSSAVKRLRRIKQATER